MFSEMSCAHLVSLPVCVWKSLSQHLQGLACVHTALAFAEERT